MMPYAVGGALIGIFIGYIFPLGSLFWFAAGAASGAVAQRYLSRRL